MTRLEAIKGSLDKWIEGEAQTKETYAKWWYHVGCISCAMCDYFDMCVNTDGEMCPLTKTGDPCAPQWDRIDNADENCKLTFALFHRNAVALRKRIQKLYDKEIENASIHLQPTA